MSSGPLIRWLTAGMSSSILVSVALFRSSPPLFLLGLHKTITTMAWSTRNRTFAYEAGKEDCCLGVNVVLFVKMQVRHAGVYQQMLPACERKPSVPKFETCPRQHTSLESQRWEGKRDRMIGMGVFTVNKNKGWRAGWLLHRNAPCSHLHSSYFFFCVSLAGFIHRHNGILSFWHRPCVSYLLGANA